MSRFFDPGNGIWSVLGSFGELVMLSLLWAICCVPIVTIGSSTAALYDSVVRVTRKKEDDLFARFFGTFRRELKSGILSTLVWLAASGILFLLFTVIRKSTAEGPVRNTALILYAVLIPFFVLCVLCWVFPLLSRFTFDTAGLNITAARLAFGHIIRSVGAALLAAAGIAACYFMTTPIIFVPGVIALLWSYLMEPVFQKYEK